MLEGFQWGGQLMITSDVENYPGYAEGVLGPEMMKDFRRQAERFGAEFVSDDVTRVDFSERPFRVWVGEEEYRSEAVIVATGANARQLGLESEVALQGRGVSYCAVCDAAFFRERNVVVVGGGDSAMEEATFLTKFATKVTVVHRRDEFRASQIMEDRARANDKIEFITNAVVDEVTGEAGVTAVKIRDVNTGEITELPADGLFVAIGHDPNTKLFVDWLDLDAGGYIITKPGSTETNIEGVFAVGDVVDHVYRQAVTAAGMGCMGALDAERWLAAREGHLATALAAPASRSVGLGRASGCGGSKTVTETVTAEAKTGAGPPSELEFGYINSLKLDGEDFRMKFDPAWFLSGETANVAAAEDGAVEPGEPVPNDNYRVDEGHRLLTYRVPSTAEVTVLTDGPSGTPVTVAQLADLVAGENPGRTPVRAALDRLLDPGGRRHRPLARPAVPAVGPQNRSKSPASTRSSLPVR